ncbi:MAG TPA: hypothetical protein VG013_39795 [Gemmataceae bacterium]|jgi:hypothetical protein|nr:hypothetical protein [Gemmataceae bacterium]
MPNGPLPVNNSIATGCPRCRVQLPQREMIKHLWLEHRLLFDEGAVRDPWQLIEEWIQKYCREGDPELLFRCRALAQRVDPPLGLMRVRRLFLAHGIDDAEARQTILAEARLRHACVCPGCYALVPAYEEAPVRPLNVARGRLSAVGYRIEVSDSHLLSRLEIETPAGSVFRGREPGRTLTRKGAMYLLVGPPVLLALAAAVALAWNASAFGVVISLLVSALVAFLWVQFSWRQDQQTLADRAVDYAWTLFVPRLHARGFSMPDSSFLAALALTSAAGHGRVEARGEIVQRLLNDTKKAFAAGTGSVVHLAALWRLAAADTARSGGDPVLLVVTQVGHYFDNKLPLAFAEHLLAGCRNDPWAAGHLDRLRVLLCERAFEAALEVRDLAAIGQAAPGLGDILRTYDADNLARLRLLWSVRPRRPWDRHGDALTAFDVAADRAAGARFLQHCPDLLLLTRQPPVVYLCGRGLIFQGQLFREPPRRAEIKPNVRNRQGAYELLLDNRSFRFADDPEQLLDRLERWFRYYFQEFLPEVAAVHGWQAPNAPSLTTQVAVRCPECRRAMLTRPGEMAVLVDAEAFGLTSP